MSMAGEVDAGGEDGADGQRRAASAAEPARDPAAGQSAGTANGGTTNTKCRTPLYIAGAR